MTFFGGRREAPKKEGNLKKKEGDSSEKDSRGEG